MITRMPAATAIIDFVTFEGLINVLMKLVRMAARQVVAKVGLASLCRQHIHVSTVAEVERRLS